jgi:hypothetical protein
MLLRHLGMTAEKGTVFTAISVECTLMDANDPNMVARKPRRRAVGTVRKRQQPKLRMPRRKTGDWMPADEYARSGPTRKTTDWGKQKTL